MSVKASVDVYYDQETSGLITSNVSGGAIATSAYPEIFCYGDYVFRYRIYSDAPTQKDLSNVDSFSFKLGQLGSTDAFIQEPNSSFNSTADWSAVNTSTGQICVTFDANVAAMQTALTTNTSRTYYAQVFGSNTTGTVTTCVIAVHPVTVHNLVDNDNLP